MWQTRPEKAADGDSGVVELRFGGAEARTLRPDSVAAFTGYRITFGEFYNGEDHVHTTVVIPAEQTVYRQKLPRNYTNQWYAAVAALIGDIGNNGSNAKEVAFWRQDNISLQNGGKATAFQVALEPEAADGEGAFKYTVSVPAGLGIGKGSLVLAPLSLHGETAKAFLTLDGAAAGDGVSTVSGSLTLSAGYYLATAELWDGTKSGSKTAVAHIYKNLETSSDDAFVFTAADFSALTMYSTADYSGLAGTLDALKSQAPGEYTVVLDTDESAFAPYTLTTADFANKIVTLRGGAYDTVKLSGSGSLFTTQSGVSLVLKDVTLKGRAPEGVSVDDYWNLPSQNRNNVALIALDGASLVLEAGSRITGNFHSYARASEVFGGGVCAENNASVVINGGSVDGNMVDAPAYMAFSYGGGVALLSGSSLTLNSGAVYDNAAHGDYRGIGNEIYADALCPVVINGGFISRGSGYFGSNEALYSRGTVQINGGQFSSILYVGLIYAAIGGTASIEMRGGMVSGGGVGAGTFVMYGGEINGSGGVSAESVVIYNGRISIGRGGSPYGESGESGIYASGDVVIHNADISNNTGWAVRAAGNVTIYNGIFNNNAIGAVIAGDGGANAGKGVLTIHDGTFTGNGGSLLSWLLDNGHDICAAAAGNDVVISGGTFTGNRSGVYFRKTFALTGGVIEDNETDITVGHETVYNPDTLLYETTRCVFALDAAFAEKTSYRPDWNWAVSGDFTMNAGQARSVTVLGSAGSYESTRTAGIFTLNGGKINGTFEGGLVTVGDGSVFTMNGGEVSGNVRVGDTYYARANGVRVWKGGAFAMNNGVVKDNQGIGVWVIDGVFTMSGGEISGNSGASGSFGGGVCLETSSIYDADYYARFTLSGGTIKNNTAEGAGGVCVWNGSVFTMSNGSIENNMASTESTNSGSNHGGGVFNGGTFAMSGGTISGNSAQGPEGTGGGVYNDGAFYFSGGVITGNSAARGSGISLDKGLFISGGAKIDESNTLFIAGPTYVTGGELYGYIALNGPLTGNGLVAKIDLAGTMAVWKDKEIIKLKGGYTGAIPVERFALGDFVDPDYGGGNDIRTPMTGYTIRADGRGSWCAADASILSFSIAGVQGRINGNDIFVTLPHTTDIGALAPLITLSGGATVSPALGQLVDFKDPSAFTVTASDGSSRIYTVTVFLTGSVPRGGLTIIDAFTALPGGITPVVNGMVVSFTGEGFTGYSWYVDGILRETGSNAINMSGYPPGRHNVTLTALKNGIPYSSQAVVTVQ